jgi:septal ring factor EnvC (AmiA/AmiB activator)
MIDELETKLAEIASLRRRIIEQESTIARQDAQLVQYAKMLDAERAAVARLRANVVQLRTALDAVPVAQLRRQYSVEPMTVHDFGLDAQDVAAWLRSLDGDA